MTSVLQATSQRTCLKILLVEDNLDDAELIQTLLLENQTFLSISLTPVTRMGDAVNLLLQSQFDAILLDFSLPDSQGSDTLARVQEYGLNIPIIVLTANNDEELAVQAIQAGAQDYLLKSEINSKSLLRSLRCAIERHHRQTGWQQSEEKYRTVVDNLKEVIFQTDITGKWTFLNPAWVEITGFSVAESLGNLFLNYIHPDDRQASLTQFHSLIEEKQQSNRYTIRYLTKTGNYRWIEVQSRLTFNLKGLISGTTGTLNDITEQILAQEKLKAATDFLNHTINAIPDPIFVKDQEHRFLAVNDATCELMGKTRTEILGKSDYDFFPKEQADIFWKKDELVLNTGKPNQNEESLTDNNGEIHILSTKKTAFTTVDGSKILVGAIRDVTEYKRQQAALQQSENRFQKLATNLPGMIYQCQTKPDGTLSFPYISLGSRQIYELEPEEIYQNPDIIFSRTHPEDIIGLQKSIALAIKTEQPWRWEWRNIMRSGEIKWLQGASRPEKQPNGDIIWDGLVIDITELKKAQESLRQSKRFIQKITASIPNILYLYDIVDKQNIYSNRHIAEMLDYTPEQIQAMGTEILANLMHPEDFATYPEYLKQMEIGAEGDIFEIEYRLQHSDGSWRTIVSRDVIFATTTTGQPKQILSTATDITEQKEAEEKIHLLLAATQAISQSANLHTALAEILHLLCSNIGWDFGEVWIPNTNTNVLECSEGFYASDNNLEIFREQSKNITFAPGVGIPGRIWLSGQPEWIEDVSIVQQPTFYRSQIAAELGLKACFGVPIRLEGEVLAVLVFFNRRKHTKNLKSIELVNAVATQLGSHIQRKQSELALLKITQALRLSEERLQLALESSDLGSWDWNIITGETYFDSQWKRIIGYEIEDIENNYQSWEKLIHTEDLPGVKNALLAYLSGQNSIYEVEFRMLNKTGIWQWILATGKVVEKDEKGNPLRMTGTHKDISDRKATEAANLKLTQQLQEAQRIAHIGNWEYDIKLQNITWSEELFRIYHLPQGQTPNFEEILSQIHPEDREKWLEAVKRAKTEGIAYDIDYRIYLPNRELKYINSKGQALRDENGQIVRLLGIAMDITDRKEAEAALKESEQRFRAIFERAAIGIAQVWPDGQFLKVNSGFCKIVGYSKAQLMKRTFMDITHPDDLELNLEYTRKLLTGKLQSYNIEKRFIRADGEIIWVNLTVSVVREETGEVKYFVKIIEDITDRFQAQTALRSAQARLQHLLASSPAVIYSCKVSGDFGATFISDNITANFGYKPQDFLENSSFWVSHIHPDDTDRVFSNITHLFKHGYHSHEYRFLHADGSYRWIRDELKLIRDENGNPIEGVGSWIDISDRRQAEEALQQQLLRERLVSSILDRIRQSLNLEEILQTAVAQIREFLQTDRTVIYRFKHDWTGVVVVESVRAEFMAIKYMNIADDCFLHTYVPLYQKGRISFINNIDDGNLDKCHQQMLAQLQVKANLVIPILQGENLWGLLIAHHCSNYRNWQELEIECLKQISVQVAIAIQQSTLFEQAQIEIADRKQALAALRDSESRERSKAIQLEIAMQKLKNAQAHLVQNEKMVSLGQLVAGVAHEINNPVSFIYGNLSPANQYASDLLDLVKLYQNYYPEPPTEILDKIDEIDLEYIAHDLPKLFNSIKVGAERIREIVKSLRIFSRLDESDRKSVDIHEGIESTLLILQNRIKPHGDKLGIQIIKEYQKLPEIECYAGQLNQVFMNIISNAIDSLEERNKTLPLEQIHHEPSTITIRTYLATEGYITISIADNGLGIKPSLISKLFDPFFTTKPVGKGTGLGLSISHSVVVDKHGGKLNCISAPGEGAEFIIEIPIKPPETTN